jgi:hypothetical protein
VCESDAMSGTPELTPVLQRRYHSCTHRRYSPHSQSSCSGVDRTVIGAPHQAVVQHVALSPASATLVAFLARHSTAPVMAHSFFNSRLLRRGTGGRCSMVARSVAPPPRQAATTAAPLAESPATSAEASASPRQVVKYGESEFVVEENPELKSTWGQRATVGSSACAMAALLGLGCWHCDNALVGVAAFLLGYVFAGERLFV